LRCLENHRVDPTTAEQPRILTRYELKHFRSSLEMLIVNAQEELDQLYRVVHQAGYVILLCNSDGVAIEHRGQETLASEFKYWGTWLGGVWSEAIEGTNGIGTCIAEQRPDGMDIPARLVLNGTGEVCHALITPPESTPGAWRNPALAGLHTRPRLGLLGSLRPEPHSLARGGLPPQVLRRIREYVDAHVDRNIDLETLASTAQLSVYHFARAFKQSTGVTPHGYLLQRRVERAQELLVRTNLPLSEIALETGFADHSHFARQFRRLAGMSPSEVRRSRY
jgi:AraC-like DNA-binding protein